MDRIIGNNNVIRENAVIIRGTHSGHTINEEESRMEVNNKMKKMFQTMWLLGVLVLIAACGDHSRFKYESVPGDPLNARIYTLDNGLKVYMTVNKDQPRIQTYVAVRAGGKNDPAETTGLAHYFEHLMFKGTDSFGTQNYEQEKPMLDR